MSLVWEVLTFWIKDLLFEMLVFHAYKDKSILLVNLGRALYKYNMYTVHYTVTVPSSGWHILGPPQGTIYFLGLPMLIRTMLSKTFEGIACCDLQI